MTRYTVNVDDDLWEKFKRTVTKDKTLNQVIVELISERVEKWSTSGR
jgi:hypothetical protein